MPLQGSGGDTVTLDVVLPTYKRTDLLRKALESLLRAPVPDGLEVSIIVVDNNSGDDTPAVVAEIAAAASLPVRYVLERKQGLSNARNGGIAASQAELVGFIDDDEEIEPSWFTVIGREFADSSLDFIGGPCLANWVTPIPDWLPPGYHSVIGAVPPKPRALFDRNFAANLMGGNAVIRRRVFSQVGVYAPHLGRSNKGLLSEEDAEFYRRLQNAQLKGVYVPDLAILHYIAPDRLTRKYHRRWVYWRGISQGVADREHQENVSYLFGVPRYKIGRALRAFLLRPFRALRGLSTAQAFAEELSLWDLAGFIYGKFRFRASDFYADEKPVLKEQTSQPSLPA